jgi:hypothetical protein
MGWCDSMRHPVFTSFNPPTTVGFALLEHR